MSVKQAGTGQFTIPTAPAAGVSVVSGAANTFTTTAIVVSASTGAIYITGVHVEAAAALGGTYFVVQLMIGAGGSETAIGQFLVPLSTGSTVALGYRPIFPPIPVANASRLSVKTADSVGSKTTLVSVEAILQSNVVDDGIAITTVTTVTNQLTAAQIATGVWQDTTAGDFTAALSVGKSIMNGVALGTGLTINAYTGNTAQTGDAFARLGAPAGASVSADVAAVKADTGAVKASQILATGTATAGAASTITLQSALGADTLPVGCIIAITGGTGVGQARVITGYVNSTKVTTVGHAWTTNPDATSVYYIIFNDAPKVDLNLKVAGVVLTDTVTTVTNQLTAAAVATGVWQDTTAGDFTAANSIGKSVLNGVALGTGLTINAYTGNTAQTGDAYARLGAPAGASHAADTAAVKADTAAVKASQVLATGTAAAGGAATITLQTALGADSLPVGCLIAITSGTGVGQCRVISAYVNSTKVATVGHNWTTNPDNTSVYYIINADAAKVDSSLKVAGVVLTDTVTTYTGNSVQTGDSYAKVADGTFGLSAIKGYVDDIGVAGAGLTALGDTRIANLDATVSSRSTYAGGAVASVTGAVGSVTGSVGSIAGITFPTNFSSMVIDATGRVNAFLIGILTTVFTEGAAGRIAAAFKQFFNIASPAATMDHGILVDTVTTYTGNTVQTGDSFARIGAAGAGLTALGDTRIANLDATVSSRTKPADTQARVTLVDTVTTYTGNTPQTGDAYARLGAPAGASHAADTAAVKADTAAVKASQVLATGTAAAGGASTITLQTALGADSLPVGCLIAITSGTGAGQCRVISAYVNATKVTTVGHNWTTNPDNTSVYYIINADAAKVDASLKVAGVVLTDTITTYTGNTPQTGDSYVKVDTEVAAIKAKTDSLTFTVANQVDSNIQSVNDTTVTGDGHPGSEWGS